MFVGSGGAGLSTAKPRRQDGNESRQDGGQAPDQASSGRQTGAAAHARTVHSQGTHEAASHPTSHTRHDDNQAGDGPRQTDRPVLPSPEDDARSAVRGRGPTIAAAASSWAIPWLRDGTWNVRRQALWPQDPLPPTYNRRG